MRAGMVGLSPEVALALTSLGIQATGVDHKRLLAKAWPDPDFKYFSKAIAEYLLSNAK
jgi:hypothetical protein